MQRQITYKNVKKNKSIHSQNSQKQIVLKIQQILFWEIYSQNGSLSLIIRDYM